MHVSRAELRRWRRLDGIQRGGPAGHGPGVPMLQLAPGGQHKRILLIRLLIGGNNLCRHELARAVCRWETIAEHDVLARLIRAKARIGHGAFHHQPVPGDVVQRRHGVLHFGKNVGGAFICPIQTNAVRQFLGDPPVRLGLARRVNRLAAHLHRAVGVRHRAVLFRPGCGRQNDVGKHGGFG